MNKLENEIERAPESDADEVLRPVDVKQMVQVISIVAVGIALAIVTFIFEIGVMKFAERKQQIQSRDKINVKGGLHPTCKPVRFQHLAFARRKCWQVARK